MWFRHAEFSNEVSQIWREEADGVGSISERISILRSGLQRWNRVVFGHLDTRKKQLDSQLQLYSEQLPNDANFRHMLELRSELAELEAQKENM